MSFLSRHKDVAFATVEENKPKIRVFQIMKREKETLYFATATHKEVYQQLQKNPFVELLAMAVNPEKRNVMVVKNEMRFFYQKRNVLQI